MRTVEESLLCPANQLLDEAAGEVAPLANRTDGRLAVLEAVASAAAGWDLREFWALTRPEHEAELSVDPRPWADKLLSSISALPIPVPLTLSALSREILPVDQKRKTGAYHTDWRLAELLAKQSVPKVQSDGPWIDTACGTGMLLAAVALETRAGADRDALIRDKLAGADLSARSIRGALLAVSSMTEDLEVVDGFASRLLTQDSLRSRDAWSQLAPSGAALIIGNPPWEKLKVSRHELATSRGDVRHYGQSYDVDVDLAPSRRDLLAYIEQIAAGTVLQGKGEHDLYKLFLEFSIGLASDQGIIALLLPAGLIRAQGTEPLRRGLDAATRELAISVIENRARHFAIDTRFKFLSVVARVGAGRRKPIELRVADRSGTLPDEPVRIGRRELHEVRPDLSIPEVKTSDEWELFARLSRNGITVGDRSGPWQPSYCREVDMTLDRKHFLGASGIGTVPLIEGRHVGQYRWRAKSYQKGEGRAAIWKPEPPQIAELRTHWFVQQEKLRPGTASRVTQSRIGFCDITGQTNERSLLLARVPSGVVCGNKVPTLAFSTGGTDREDLFLALSNSFVVDWMMRRLVTTTVNFFLLNSLPLPAIDEGSEIGTELVSLARKLSKTEGDTTVDWRQVDQWRARIDALVAVAWGLHLNDMELVLSDFPLIDRGQPPLLGEARSTITADSVLAELAKIYEVLHPSTDRSYDAREQGAKPYIPAEFA